MTCRLLFLTAETCPTFRADVDVLFGKYLPRHGVNSDIATGLTPGEVGRWGGGEALLCDVSGGQARKHIMMLLHGIRVMFMADRARYDAIQVRDMPVLGLFGLIAARLKGMLFYYWMSYPMSEGQVALARERGLSAGLMKFLFPYLRGLVGYRVLYFILLPRADHVFVQSERMREDLAARGIGREKMTPVPMAVDTENAWVSDLLPSDDQRLQGRRVLVYLGSLDRPRQIEVLFVALAEARKHCANVLLVMVGDTEDEVHRAWLRRNAIEAGVDDLILWTGWLPVQEAWRYVKAAEVGLSPIPRGVLLDCSSPTKLPEYLYLGVPVVCNDNPDQAEVISESGAGYCVPYTPEDFARAICGLLATPEAESARMKAAGHAYVLEKRSYAHVSARVAKVYGMLKG